MLEKNLLELVETAKFIFAAINSTEFNGCKSCLYGDYCREVMKSDWNPKGMNFCEVLALITLMPRTG